jgi:UDPglucose 6-dehydrogenase
MKVAVIGTGYVGLVTGSCFAELGFQVTCVDKDAAKINQIEAGRIPIYEPDLDSLVQANAAAGRLDFTTSLHEAVASADIVFIAVGTPSRKSDGHADLAYVYGAAEEIAQAIDGYTVVVTKSTVPVGTGQCVEAIIRNRRLDAEFDIVSNPEFLREGSAISDFMQPDRIVIGARSDKAFVLMRRLYAPLENAGARVVTTSVETAELTKYAANSFLATKISFINEIADLCEAVGANVEELAEGVGLDARIGRQFLNAGPGYGGSCFPKDCQALIQTARDAANPLRIIEAVVEVNERRKWQMAQRIIAASGNSIQNKKIALLGLTFKPNTDDVRDSPSLTIAPALVAAGAYVSVYDPEGMKAAALLMPELHYAANAYEAVEKAHAVVLLTEWEEFLTLDLPRLRSLMHGRVFVDLRNAFEEARMQEIGFAYSSIGRSGLLPAAEIQVAA